MEKGTIRVMNPDEVGKLKICIEELARYHNTVSTNFKGNYPRRPYDITLEAFREALENKSSMIAVMEEQEKVIGFCKVDFQGSGGKLDYLVIMKEYRSRGFGKRLMDWAIQMFAEHEIQQIEVKVVDGNETIHLYEKYGFKMNAHILTYDKRKIQEMKQNDSE